MADVINLMAEHGRNIIEDDAVPTLELGNSYATAGGGGTALKASSTADHVLDIVGAGIATIAPIKAVNSVASGVLLEIGGSLISSASLTVYQGSFPIYIDALKKVVYLHGYQVV